MLKLSAETFARFEEIERLKYRDHMVRSLVELDPDAPLERRCAAADAAFVVAKGADLHGRDSLMGLAILIHYRGADVFKTDPDVRPIADARLPESRRKTLIHALLNRSGTA